MKNEPQPDLEAFIHGELQRLPDLSAPDLLSQRVLKAIKQSEADAARPWWRRAWWSWPTAAKVFSSVLFSLLGVTVCVVPWALGDFSAAFTQRVDELLAPVQQWLASAVSMVSALNPIGQSIAHHPWVLGTAAAALLAYLILIGIGTFYVRFAVQHSSTSLRHD